MIKANELRIGNCLLYENSDGEIITSKINLQDFRFISKDEHEFNEWHKPIPLTEAILLKCGFEKHETILGSYVKKCFTFHSQCPHIEDKFTSNIEIYFFGNRLFIKDIKYLHQLQNLYFVLTGEELEITLH